MQEDYPRKLNGGIEGACPTYNKRRFSPRVTCVRPSSPPILGVLTDGASFGGIFRGAARDLRLLGFRFRRPRYRARWRGCCFGFARPPHLKCSFRIVDQRMTRGLLLAALDLLVEPQESIRPARHVWNGCRYYRVRHESPWVRPSRASRASGDLLCPGLCRGGLARACRILESSPSESSASCGLWVLSTRVSSSLLKSCDSASKIRHGSPYPHKTEPQITLQCVNR